MSISAGADPDIMVPSAGSSDTVRAEPSTAGHRLGAYAGVKPGSASVPPVPAPKSETRPVITWPGFQMRPDGTSRVFIQSTTALTSMPVASPAKFSLHLPGAKVSGNTNRLPLETRFFNTPVARVNIEEKRDGVTLVLDLRGDVEPVVSSERGPAGFYFLYIDLPKGQYVKTAPALAEAPPPPPSTTERAKTLEDSSEVKAEVKTEANARGNVESTGGGAKVKGSASGKAGIKLGL